MGLHVPLLVQLQRQAQFFPKRPLGQTAQRTHGLLCYVVSQISSINDLHGLWHLDILIRHQWSVLFLFVNLVSFESVCWSSEAFVMWQEQHAAGQLTLVAQCTSEAWKTITLSCDMVTRSITVDTLRAGLTTAVTKVTRRADYRKAGETQRSLQSEPDLLILQNRDYLSQISRGERGFGRISR